MASVAMDRFLWLLVGIGLVGIILLWRIVSTRKEGFQVAPGVSIPTEESCELLSTLLVPLTTNLMNPDGNTLNTTLDTSMEQLAALYKKASYNIKCIQEFADTVPILPETVCPVISFGKKTSQSALKQKEEDSSVPREMLKIDQVSIDLYRYLESLAGCPATG